MDYNSIINNKFFSPLKFIPKRSSNRSQHDIFSSSERKKKSIEKSQDFLSSTIKKTNEEEYEEVIRKRNAINKKIDDAILLLTKKENEGDLVNDKKRKERQIFQKYLSSSNKNHKNLTKLLKNENLKQRNIYLKNMVKELRAKCQINNSNNSGNKYNGLTYEYLLKQNKELINENNNLKEEYNLLKLDQNNSFHLEKIVDNKYEIISKIKTLKYSMDNFINLLSFQNISNSNNKNNNNTENNKRNRNNYNENLIKSHSISKYDLSLQTNELVQNNYYTNNSNLKIERNKIYKDFKIFKKNKLKLSNIIFTEGGNLLANKKNNSIYTNNINESSDDDPIEIDLKKYEKIGHRSLNNLITNSGRLNINSNPRENITSTKHKNMPIFTEKRKNTLTITSDNKEVIKNKKINKNFRQYFKEGKNTRNTGGNHTNYNFYNIFMDKKIIIDNNLNLKSSRLNNNKAASKCKYNKTYEKNNKGNNDICSSHKSYKINSGSNHFNKMTNISKRIFNNVLI